MENPEQGLKERHSVEFSGRTSKSGIPMLSASFRERDPDGKLRQVEGKGGGLKPNEAVKQLGDQDRTVQMAREKFGVDVLAPSKEQAQGVER